MKSLINLYTAVFCLLLCLAPCQAETANHSANPANPANRQMRDAYGELVTLPAQPKRIIALSEPDLDALLALKIQPVGASQGRGQAGLPHYLAAQAQGIPSVGQFASPVLDVIIGLRPDLILAGGIADPQLLAQLRKIAPTVASFKVGQTWQSALQQVATALAKEAQAAELVKQYQARGAALRQKLLARAPQGSLESISIVRWNAQGPSYLLQDAFASRVLADLQIPRPALQMQSGAAHSPILSLEALPKIDADWLLLGTFAGNQAAASALQKAQQHPLFAQLQAAKKQHLRTVDASLWTGPGGPLAAQAVLQELENLLLAK